MGWVASWVSVAIAVTACGADATDVTCPDAGATANPGFGRPASPTMAHARDFDGTWRDLGPADWSCLGEPWMPEPTTVDVALSGVVTDSFPGETVANADVAVFHFGGARDGQLIDAATTDDAGAYAVSIAAGTAAITLRVTSSAGTHLDLYELPVTLAPGEPTQTRDITIVSLEVSTLPRPDGGLVLGRVVDCQDRRVSHAVATASTSADRPEHVPGATTNYFSAGSTSLPVRLSVRADTNRDGMFLISDTAAPDPLQVQAWGFPAGPVECDTAMTRLGTLDTLVPDGSVVVTTVGPRR